MTVLQRELTLLGTATERVRCQRTPTEGVDATARAR